MRKMIAKKRVKCNFLAFSISCDGYFFTQSLTVKQAKRWLWHVIDIHGYLPASAGSFWGTHEHICLKRATSDFRSIHFDIISSVHG